MAIIYKNPMPMSGALFVENPRRNKRKSAAVVRRNYAKDRLVRKYSNMSLKQIKDLKSSNYSEFQKLFAEAERKEALSDYKKRGKAFRSGLKKSASARKSASEFFSSASERAKYLGADSAKKTKKTKTKRKGATTAKQSRSSSSKRATQFKVAGGLSKAMAKKLSIGERNKLASSLMSELGVTRKEAHAMIKAGRLGGVAFDVDAGKKVQEVIKAARRNNPKRKRSSMKSNPVSETVLRRLQKKAGKAITGRKYKSASARLKAYHRELKKLLKEAHGYSTASKKKRKASSKKTTSKKRSSKKTTSRKPRTMSQAMSEAAILKEAKRVVDASGSAYTNEKLRQRAIERVAKKLRAAQGAVFGKGGGATFGKGKRKAATSAKRKTRSSSKRKSTSRKLSDWQKKLKILGGRGFTPGQIRELAQRMTLKETREYVKTVSRRKYDVKKRGYKKARAQRLALPGAIQHPILGEIAVRNNPAILSLTNALGSVQSFVGGIPIVRTVAPLIAPLALGAGVYYVHQVAEPYVMPLVTKVGGVVARVPVVGRAVPFLLTKPYTMTGIAAYALMMGLDRYGLISKTDARMVGYTAVAMGIGLDLSLKPFAEAAAAVESQLAVADEASAQEEIAVDSADAMGAVHMGAVHMGAVHMGRLAVDEDYFDASFGDAYAAGDDMHPEEISAVIAGRRYFKHKFGQSPRRLSSKQSIYSRHAGRQGHRFGWLIKMVGFANFQKIAALPPHQRRQVIGRLRQQAIQSLPKVIAQVQAAQPALETASLPIDGAANAVGGVDGIQYGALMFAGNGY
jgi:hypothetical protein